MNEPSNNTQIAKDAYAAFGRGDIPAILNLVSDDVDWFLAGPQQHIPVAGRRRGRKQVGEFFAAVAEHQEAQQFEPKEFIAQGDKVIALGHYRFKIKSTGKIFETDWAHVFTIRDGKIVKFQEHYDSHAAFEAYRKGA